MRLLAGALALMALSPHGAHAQVRAPADQNAAAAGEGLTFPLTLKHAAYRSDGAPSAMVHVPAGFDPSLPLELVVFLHGFNGCSHVLMTEGRARCRPDDLSEKEDEGWALARHHDEAHTNSVLVIPQLAFMKRSSKPGCFGRAGCFDAFLDELLAELRTRLSLAKLDAAHVDITLVAHSAGYQTALAILDRAGSAARVQNVVLMDALYGGAPQFAYWLQKAARRGVRMLSLYLNEGDTRRGSRDLYKRARRALGQARVTDVHHDGLDAALAAHKTLVVSSAHGIHREVPANYLAKVLTAWLPARK
jgi:pimeloyl-ACP methyl ester carboxylesterase